MDDRETGEFDHQNPFESPHADSGPPPEAGAYSQDERMWAMLCHLSTLSGFIIPFGNIIGPLVIWLTKKEGSVLIDDQGKEALNFQISMTIYSFVAAISIMCFIGIVLLPAVMIVDVVFTIIACIKANSGEFYRYPLSIRFVN